MNNLIKAVEQWAENKGIMTLATPSSQFRKTLEEVEELNEAITARNIHEVKDAIGDIVVTLVIQAKMWDSSLEECLQQAYDVISKRTGKMIDGQFVKD